MQGLLVAITFILGWHNLSGQQDATANMVLCNLSFHCHAPRRERQGTAKDAWRDL